jgi:hypothetical protein
MNLNLDRTIGDIILNSKLFNTLQGFTSNTTPHDCNTTNLVAIGGRIATFP